MGQLIVQSTAMRTTEPADHHMVRLAAVVPHDSFLHISVSQDTVAVKTDYVNTNSIESVVAKDSLAYELFL